jgi:hypothetical protein
MYVEALSEGSRTRVRFPPPPPFIKAKAPMVLGLLLFEIKKNLRFLLLASISSNGMTYDDGVDKNK